jgi:hypothetical protein
MVASDVGLQGMLQIGCGRDFGVGFLRHGGLIRLRNICMISRRKGRVLYIKQSVLE